MFAEESGWMLMTIMGVSEKWKLENPEGWKAYQEWLNDNPRWTDIPPVVEATSSQGKGK